MTFEKSDQKILVALLEQDDQTVRGLLQSADLSHPAVMSSSRRLCAKKLVRMRIFDGKTRISLTKKGREAAELFAKSQD